MGSLDTTPATLGLRERKKQQTRQKIARAALRLFAERGYDETTLADIAAAADVAPRTIFAYYEGKEDILLSDESSLLTRLQQTLDERPDDTTTVDALRDFLGSLQPADEDFALRKQIIAASPALQLKLNARHSQLEPMLARSIARDLGAEPDDLRAVLAAASVTAAFTAVRRRLSDESAPPTTAAHQQGMAILDDVLEFLHGGLEALRRDG
jgi:TetR/AcrR family transcriptional regulator, regulator of mycofactocin system